MDLDEVLAATFSLVAPHLTERRRRLLLGAAARALGYGGVSRVARLAGASRPTVRWEANQLTETIGATVIPMLCAYMTSSCLGRAVRGRHPVLTPRRLVATLRALPPHIDEVGVMLLAEHARHQLHPAT